MSEKKHDSPDQDLNAVLERVEQLLGDGSLAEPMGGFEHLSTDESKTAGLKLDPGAAARLHAKPEPKVHIETYGCQMNEHDTEIMHGLLSQMGYKKAIGPEDADVLLFNTCAVRESAVEHAFGRIHQLKPLKYTNPDLVIGVCGCVPQVEGQVDRIKRIFPYLDMIFGTHNLHRLPELIEQSRGERETVVDVWEAMGEDLPDLAPAHRKDDLKAWVTIMYGCDKNCTYCIVPMTRGAERSRPHEVLLQEVQDLARRGFKEITLLGQNVNAYGKDLYGRHGETFDFGDLVEALDQNTPGLERIRFTTNHPKDFSRKMVEQIARSKKVCEWFHLPVQSGSDAVLRRMKRSYNIKQYMQLIGWVRELIPTAVITTDVIVGFPGETEEEFQLTLDLMERVGYDSAFMFMYSERAGTPAAEMDDRLTPEEKKARLHRLLEVQNRQGKLRNESRLGTIQEALVECLDKKNTDVVMGRTRGNIVVTFPGDASLIGQLVKVEITKAGTWTLEGLMVESPVASASY